MKILYLIVFLVMLFSVSCQKEEAVNDSDSENVLITRVGQPSSYEELIVLDSVEMTEDGALNFLSVSAYYRGIEKLLNRSHRQLDLWEQSIGFKSMRSEVKRILDMTYNLTDEFQKSAIVQQNTDLIEIGNRGEVKPIVEAVFYRNILNKAGCFYLNGDKYQVTKENVVITYNNIDSLKRKEFPRTISFSYFDKAVMTRAQPGKNLLTGSEGCWSDKIVDIIPNTNDELWIETKYKIYKDCLVPPALLSNGKMFFCLNYYVQLDGW